MRDVVIALFLAAVLVGCSVKEPTYGNIQDKQTPSTHVAENWQVSPTFESGGFTMRGEKGRLGFIDAPFIAGKGNKYMWHFWGNPDELVNKKLKVVAISKDTGQKIEQKLLYENLGGANNGADASLPSTLSLPTPGLWRFDVYVDDKFFGSIVVEAKSEN